MGTCLWVHGGKSMGGRAGEAVYMQASNTSCMSVGLSAHVMIVTRLWRIRGQVGSWTMMEIRLRDSDAQPLVCLRDLRTVLGVKTDLLMHIDAIDI